MKKRRIVAFALATTMLTSSMSFNSFADETTVLPEAAVEVSDDVESGAASVEEESLVEEADDSVEAFTVAEADIERVGGLARKVTEPWRGAVFGDAGGKEKVMGYSIMRGKVTMAPGAENESGEIVPYYVVAERDNGVVNTRMGVNDAKNQANDANTGKISGSSDGIVYYYQELEADDNFVLSAKGYVNAIDNANNQVSFGAMARDYVIELTPEQVALENVFIEGDAATSNKNYQKLPYDNTIATNFVAAGPLRMNQFGSSSNGYISSFYRLDEKLYNYEAPLDERLYSKAEALPVAGGTYDVKLVKSDKYYYLEFADEGVVVDNVPLGEDEGKIYAGLFASRNADIDWSDISLEKIDATALEITSLPKTNIVVGDEFSTAGLELKATLADGSSVNLNTDDDIIVTDIDTATIGTKTVYVSYGGQTVSFDVQVEVNQVTDLELKYAPLQNEFCAGAKFNTTGMEIVATYLNSSETINESQYKITMDGKEIDETYYFTSSDVGTKTIKVEYIGTENIKSNDKYVTFNINVSEAVISSIDFMTYPTLRQYSVGDTFDSAGLVVKAIYDLGDGTRKVKALADSEYTLSCADASGKKIDLEKPFATEDIGTLNVKVTFNNDTKITNTFTVDVVEKKAVRVYVRNYPRLNYGVGEEFNSDGLVVYVVYNNGKYEPLTESERNEDGTYKALTGLTYQLDTTGFKNSSLGETGVVVVKTLNGDLTLETKIVDDTTRYWKASLMGQSSMGAYDGDPTSNITVYDMDGNSTFVSGDAGAALKELPVGIMKNGKMTNVSKLNVTSWDGAGKYATDHDGIAYYYTRIDADNNFKISADFKVNRYIRDPKSEADGGTDSQQKDYDVVEKAQKKYQQIFDKNGLPITVDWNMAIDMSRSGQEAFGIMARDVIPLYAPISEGGNDNLTTTDINVAHKDKYGEPKNIFEVYNAKMAGVENSDITMSDINDIAFSSNVIVAGGATSSTFPTDPSSGSFYTKSVQNRINLSYRSGVLDTDGAGSKTKGGFYTTTQAVPKPGDEYKVTLERINYGYVLTTTDKQTGQTETVYCFDAADELNNLLTTQDPDNIYIGFFACRYADFDVENIELYETLSDEAPIISDLNEDIYNPSITVESSLFTDFSDYTLNMKASNPSGGIVTIKQNDKVIYDSSFIAKKTTSFSVNLVENSANSFTVVYRPSNADNLTSYDEIVYRFYVVHKDIDSDLDVVYVGPNGTVSGDGTRENPIDLETAVGLAQRGRKIIMLDGTYNINEEINISKTNSGTYKNKKYLIADEGANPVVDLRGLSAGFLVNGDYWHFKGITVTNSQGNSKTFHVGGSHNIIENCTFHDNGDAGFQISRLDGDATRIQWPSNNLVLNCEAYNNCDPSKNNADGFACKLTVGDNNLFKGCVSHHNLDDGWDLYTKLSTGAIGVTYLENCATYRNGFHLLEDGTDTSWEATSGGNGYKMGGESIYVQHYLKDSLTFLNKGNGFDTNTNPTIKIRNVVSYNNVLGNIALYTTKRSLFDYDIKGFVSYKDAEGTETKDTVGTVTEYDAFKNNNANPLVSDSNYFMYSADFLASNAYGITGTEGNSYNANSQAATADMFKSVNMYDSLGSNMRYTRDENGAFIFGDFLARTTEYVHDAGDEIPMPDTGFEGVDEPTTEVTTNGNIENTETTTKKATTSNGGGGGGGGSSSIKATTTVSSEATTEASTEASTEATTSANVVAVGNVEVSIGEYAVVINGTAYDVDAAAYIQAESQSTLVPLRFVALAIAGGNVADADNSDAIVWNAVDKSATIFAGNRVIVFQAGSDIMVVDNTPQLMDNGVKAEITDGRMYVPFRALGKALGVDVDWDANTKTAKFIAPVVEETTEATTEEVTDEATTEEVTADAEEETTTVDASEETTVAETEVEETTEEVTEA